MGREELYKGTVSGVVTSNPTYAIGKGPALLTFSIQMDEEIEGIPKELGVSFFKLLKFSWDPKLEEIIIRKGDRVIVKGVVITRELKPFSKNSIILKARTLYNETLKCDYE